jgi:hypothetical protein
MQNFIDEVYKVIKLNSLSEEEKKEIDLYLQHISNNLQNISELKKQKNYHSNLFKIFSQLINEK